MIVYGVYAALNAALKSTVYNNYMKYTCVPVSCVRPKISCMELAVLGLHLSKDGYS